MYSNLYHSSWAVLIYHTCVHQQPLKSLPAFKVKVNLATHKLREYLHDYNVHKF